MEIKIGEQMEINNIVEKMTESKVRWEIIHSYIKDIMEKKKKRTE